MAAAAAASSLCSFFVLGNARYCTALQLTVREPLALILLQLLLLLSLML
jgi:hypothetical protein